MFLWLLNSFLPFVFEADKGAGEGGDGSANGDGQAEQETDKKSGAGDESPAWLPKRLKEEAAATERRLLKALNVKDKAELEAKLKTANDFEASQRTAAENAQAQVDTLNGQIATLTAERDAAITERDTERAERVKDRVVNALTSTLNANSVKKADDALILINTKHGDRIAKLANDKGEINQKDVDALVSDFKKANPDYFGANAGGGSPSQRDGKPHESGHKEKQIAAISQFKRVTNKR